MSAERVAADRVRAAIAANPVWYHTLELGPGLLTPGRIDLRAVAARVLPDDMSGLRALDVGAFDGFWSFEMERRGAEVVALDVDRIDDAEWPPFRREQLRREAGALGVELGRGFAIAAEVLGSRVDRRICDVYELTPERIGGAVDVVFSGAILLHLRDPVRALERIRGALRPGGELRLLESISIGLTFRYPRRPVARFSPLETAFNWWLANRATLFAWVRTAGFTEPRGLGLHRPAAAADMRGQVYAGVVASVPSASSAPTSRK